MPGHLELHQALGTFHKGMSLKNLQDSCRNRETKHKKMVDNSPGQKRVTLALSPVSAPHQRGQEKGWVKGGVCGEERAK